MGVYRDYALSLSPWSYLSMDTMTWNPPAAPYSTSTGGSVGLIGFLSKTARRPSMVLTESGTTTPGQIHFVDSNPQLAVGPDWTMAVTISLEHYLVPGGSPPQDPTSKFASPRGFVTMTCGFGVAGNPTRWWDLHETDHGTIGIATFGIWSDKAAVIFNNDPPFGYTKQVWGRYDGDLDAGTTGSDHCYIFDTGVPIADLLDGRPHLLVVRSRGANQPYSEVGPTATDTWISLSIDGVHRYTTNRGPSWSTSIGGGAELILGSGSTLNAGEATATGVDEVGFWKSHLTDGEIATLWSLWGDLSAWPHPASSTVSALGVESAPDPILRILSEAEVQHAQAANSDPDPVWVEQATEGIATSVSIVGRSFMGLDDWLDQDPWSSGWKRSGASKWLDTDQDVALVGASSIGSSTAHADLTQDEDELVGVASGQSSASGDITLHITLLVEPIAGSSTAYAITIGDLSTLAATADGAASVTGELSHGQLEYLAGSSDGGLSTSTATLSVSTYNYIDGNEVGDGDHAPAMGGGGLRRAHFSPKSVGYVNTRPNRQAVGIGTTTAGPGS